MDGVQYLLPSKLNVTHTNEIRWGHKFTCVSTWILRDNDSVQNADFNIQSSFCWVFRRGILSIVIHNQRKINSI